MTESILIPITQDPDARDLPLPSYATPGAAGMDLCANITQPVTLAPGDRVLVPTGLRLALPPDCEAQVRPRSGLALHQGLGMVNSPGTIDSDYRGAISVLLINWGQQPVTIKRGDRIAQLIIAPVLRGIWENIGDADLPASARAHGGFGHTGLESAETRHDA